MINDQHNNKPTADHSDRRCFLFNIAYPPDSFQLGGHFYALIVQFSVNFWSMRNFLKRSIMETEESTSEKSGRASVPL